MAGDYKRPLYHELKDYTSKLRGHFNENARRYVSPSLDFLIERCSTLANDYRCSYYFKDSKNEVRLNQIACISTLCANLVADLAIESNPKKRDEARDVILGAIYYRYYRLFEEYRPAGLTWGWYSAKNYCALFGCLDAILNLQDTNVMDELSVHTYLNAYLQHMTRDDYYKKFDYIARHRDYMSTLVKRTSAAFLNSASQRNDLKYVEFIKQVDMVLDQPDAEVSSIVTKLGDTLEKRKGSPLAKPDILGHLNNLKPTLLTRDLISGLISTHDCIKADGSYASRVTNKTDFRQALEQLYNVQKKMVLIGAYLIVLECSLPSQEMLFQTVAKGLKLSPENKIDSQTKHLALKAFQGFISRLPTPTIDVDVFGGLDMLKRRLVLALEHTQAQIELSEFVMLPSTSNEDDCTAGSPGPSCSSSVMR